MLQTNSWHYRTIEAVLHAKKDLEAGFTTMRDCGSMGAMYSDTDGRRAIKDGFGSWSAIAGGDVGAYRVDRGAFPHRR